MLSPLELQAEDKITSQEIIPTAHGTLGKAVNRRHVEPLHSDGFSTPSQNFNGILERVYLSLKAAEAL